MKKSPWHQIKKIKLLLSFFGLKDLDLIRRYSTDTFFETFSDETHLRSAIDWLGQAQDVNLDGGVSVIYSLRNGWDISYPETTGYIIGTFIAYGLLIKKDEYIYRAKRMGNWEISIQAPSGGIISRPGEPIIRVFNTGQVILGWCALFEQTQDESYLQSAIRAGDYLLQTQEDDGRWIKDTYCGARTYHSRVDWALLRLWQFTGEEKYASAASKNLHWVIEQQTQSGWFKNCGFNQEDPITHVIGYTLRGLIESYEIDVSYNLKLLDKDFFPLIKKTVDAICGLIEKYQVSRENGLIPSSFNEYWSSHDKHTCLTGNVQLSIVLRRFGHISKQISYNPYADLLLNAAKKMQIINTNISQVRGALPGTYPINIGYLPYSYPNWATKFLADALMLKMNDEIKLLS